MRDERAQQIAARGRGHARAHPPVHVRQPRRPARAAGRGVGRGRRHVGQQDRRDRRRGRSLAIRSFSAKSREESNVRCFSASSRMRSGERFVVSAVRSGRSACGRGGRSACGRSACGRGGRSACGRGGRSACGGGSGESMRGMLRPKAGRCEVSARAVGRPGAPFRATVLWQMIVRKGRSGSPGVVPTPAEGKGAWLRSRSTPRVVSVLP